MHDVNVLRIAGTRLVQPLGTTWTSTTVGDASSTRDAHVSSIFEGVSSRRIGVDDEEGGIVLHDKETEGKATS